MLRVLLVAGVVSIVLEMISAADHRNTAWIEGFAIILAVFIVVTVTAINDRKKELEFQKLNEKMENQKKVNVIRMGVEIDDLSMGDIVVGDIILLKQGLEVPGDGVIIQGFSVTMDESSMTGETKPMCKESIGKCMDKKVELEKKGIEHMSHHSIPSPIVLSGTKVLTGTGQMVVINVGSNSAIGKIQEIITSGEDDLTPLQLKLEGIARDIGYFGLGSSVIIFIVMILRTLISGGKEKWVQGAGFYLTKILDAFLIAITVLVVAIPEGLPLAVTLSLAFSINKMMLD